MNRKSLFLLGASLLALHGAAFAQSFTAGDIVIDTVSDIVQSGSTSGDLDTAGNVTLDELTPSTGGAASLVQTWNLPQTSSGSQSAFAQEYGSASEGILEDSENGQYLTMMGYGVNATTFNTAPLTTYGTAALGQTTSLTTLEQTATGATTTYTTVPRVVALVGANGSVDTSTALTDVFNTNNPRSATTVDGSSFYVSGQGVTGDSTGGVFYTTIGSTTATAINANTSTPSGAQTENALEGTETRTAQIVNLGGTNTLLVSRDFAPSGSPNDSTDIRSLTDASGNLPTSSTGLVATRVIAGNADGNTSSITLTTANENGVNDPREQGSGNHFVYLSPEDFFMASPTVMYVTDSGEPKNGSADAAGYGEGGLQKWILESGTWTLAYDLVSGLSLVDNATANSNTPTANGVTGLFGLAGEVVNGGSNVELFATSYGLNELSESYVYEITDELSGTSISDSTVSSEQFSTIYSAPADTAIRGVAFAPVPEPGTWAMAVGGLGSLLAFQRFRRRRS